MISSHPRWPPNLASRAYQRTYASGPDAARAEFNLVAVRRNLIPGGGQVTVLVDAVHALTAGLWVGGLIAFAAIDLSVAGEAQFNRRYRRQKSIRASIGTLDTVQM
jgi:hypothetical protein